jgi:hypothetical protein
VSCRILSRAGDVDSAFALMMTFAGGGTLLGRFGFDTEYCNRLSVLARGISLEIDRIFTIPPDMENRIVVKRNNVEERVAAPAADSFRLFLQEVFNAVKSGRAGKFARELLADAALVARLRSAAGETGA